MIARIIEGDRDGGHFSFEIDYVVPQSNHASPFVR
jgi:hypothetical protein